MQEFGLLLLLLELLWVVKVYGRVPFNQATIHGIGTSVMYVSALQGFELRFPMAVEKHRGLRILNTRMVTPLNSHPENLFRQHAQLWEPPGASRIPAILRQELRIALQDSVKDSRTEDLEVIFDGMANGDAVLDDVAHDHLHLVDWQGTI